MTTLNYAGGTTGPPVSQYKKNFMGLNRAAWLGLILIAPVILYLLLAQAYPFSSAVYSSLTDKRVGTPGAFVGLENYIDLIQEPLFRRAVFNTLVFTLGSIGAKLVLGMIMALVLNQNLYLKDLWRALLFLPWTIPTIITVLTFGWIYSATGGVLNSVLLRLHILDLPIDWLGRPINAMIALIIVNIWRGTPFFGISLLAALQSIPGEQYEAAEIDGANALQRFMYLTIPGIKKVGLLVTLVSTIWTLNEFQIIWVLTRGGPANTTQVFSTLTYTEAFLDLEIGRATAISVASVPFLILLIGWISRYLLRSDDE